MQLSMLGEQPVYNSLYVHLISIYYIYQELSSFVGKNRSKIHSGGEIEAESKNGESKFISIVVGSAAAL